MKAKIYPRITLENRTKLEEVIDFEIKQPKEQTNADKLKDIEEIKQPQEKTETVFVIALIKSNCYCPFEV